MYVHYVPLKKKSCGHGRFILLYVIDEAPPHNVQETLPIPSAVFSYTQA